MNIPEILNGIELSEEQVAALDQFFKEWSEGLATRIRSEFSEGEKKDMIPRAVAKLAFENLYQNAEKGFELARRQYKRAFDMAIKDERAKYTESMASAMQDIYADIETRVKKDFQESAEYKAFKTVRDAIAPVMMTEEQKAAVAKLAEIEAKEAALEEEKKQMSREKAISALLADFPKEYAETVKKFISKAQTEDEVYERFNAMVEMIDGGAIKKEDGEAPAAKSQVAEADSSTEKKAAAERNSGRFRRKIEESKKAAEKTGAKPVFESATAPEPKDGKGKKDDGVMSEFDKTLIGLVFPQLV